jgi:hypothetical protein
VSPEGMPETCE